MTSTNESTIFGKSMATCTRRRAHALGGHDRDLRVGTPPRRILLGMQRAEEIGFPTDWHEHRYRRRS